MSRRVRSIWAEIGKHGMVWFTIFFAFVGFYFMLVISLKDNTQFSMNPWIPTPPFHWENYKIGWEQISDKIFNTTFVAFTSVVLTQFIALMGAFFFARFKMPGSTFLFMAFIALMMYPGVANMATTFKLISSLGLYNSHWALISMAVAGGQVFNIYIFRNFIEDIPQDLFEAIEMDNGNLIQQIIHVVIPLSLPVLGTLGVLAIIGQWNSFMDPLLYIRDNEMQLLAVALLRMDGEYTKKWGELMAGYTIASIPLVICFCFCMKLFIRGLSAGAIKG